MQYVATNKCFSLLQISSTPTASRSPLRATPAHNDTGCVAACEGVIVRALHASAAASPANRVDVHDDDNSRPIGYEGLPAANTTPLLLRVGCMATRAGHLFAISPSRC
jgi:hypothetical protein